MSQNIQVAYSLFGGIDHVSTLNVQFGINETPTTVTADIITEPGQELFIRTRDFIPLKVGAFDFKGIVQSWDKAEIDLAGSGVYQIRLTDTKPVLEAIQIIIGASFQDRHSFIPFNYGNNIVAVTPLNSTQITDGINFSRIKQFVESATLSYGRNDYKVSFDFTLVSRGLDIEYSIENSVLSLSELISRVANDHGLDWYIETSLNKQISVKFFDRTENLGITFDLLKSLHTGEIIRFHQGKENRDAINKSVLIGGYKSNLFEVDGSLWTQFWGFKPNPAIIDLNTDKCKLIFKEENTNIPNTGPEFSIALMEKIINKKYAPKEFTEEDIQRVISYANEFWGRQFYAKITPSTSIDASGLPWVIPTSAGWWESDDPPVCFDHNGQLKFETDDGRWVTFVQLPLPGARLSENITFQWDDTLFSNPNTHVGPEPRTNILHGRTIWVKATLEVVGSYFVLTLAAPLRIKRIILIDTQQIINLMAQILTITKTIEPFNIRVNTIRAIIGQYTGPSTSQIDKIIEILNDTETDVQKIAAIRAIAENPNIQTGQTVTEETRMDSLEQTWLALLDQRVTYGPWSSKNTSSGKGTPFIGTSLGKTEAIIDTSLVPWNFGYHGITNSQGITDMDKAANERIKIITDTTSESDTIELQVANVPKINVGTQLNKTGALTSISVSFSTNGITTTYRSNQFNKNQNIQKRKPPGKQKPFKEFDFNQKAIPAPTVDSPKESRAIQQPKEVLFGRIFARSSAFELRNTPHYDLTPMKRVSNFGTVTLERDTTKFGDYLSVINLGEKQTAPGRLPVGTDVEVSIFDENVLVTSQGNGIIASYSINVPGPKPENFVATITQSNSNEHPTYKVTPIENVVQTLLLLNSEILALNDVTNIGEPANHRGFILPGTRVTVKWNENLDGSFTPFIEQQLNLFKPV